MKAKITIVLVVLFSLQSFAQVGTIFITGGLYYKITSATTVEVSTNPDVTGVAVIPSNVTIDYSNYQVTNIGDSAFINSYGLTAVTIPILR